MLEINRFLEDAKQYIMTYDYHTHTVFSHGKGTIEDNVVSGIQQGLKGIAITDHGPGHLTYGIKKSEIPEMRRQIEELRKKYPGFEILLGVEANIVYGGNSLDVTKEEFSQYDFVMAGYHYGVKNGYCIKNWLAHHGIGSNASKEDLRKINTEMTLNALYSNEVKILSHPGDKGPFDIMAIAKACEERNTLMEISTWHAHLTLEELKLLRNTGNKFVVSSDAHTPRRVGDYLTAVARALEAGIEPERIVNIGKR